MTHQSILDVFLKKPSTMRKHSFERKQIAVAALLVECAQVDTEITPQERQAIYAAVRRQLGLDDETCEALVAVAARRTGEVWHDWIFLEAIKRGFKRREQREILERLWEVAHADSSVHPFEASLISRAAKELGFDQAVLEETRAEVQRQVGPGSAAAWQ